MIRDWAVKLKLILTLRFVSKITLRQTDTLYKTLGQERLRSLHNVKYLILDRRATAVENQNYHVCLYV